MIAEAALAWFALVEPLGWQKEAATRDLLVQLAGGAVRPEHLPALDAAACVHRPGANPDGALGMGGRRIAVVECRFETPCGTLVRPVWHEPLLGAYITADPLIDDLASRCPEMLLPGVLEPAQEASGG